MGVAVAYLHPGWVESKFMTSMTRLLMFDVANTRRILDGGALIEVGSGPNVSDARNKIMRSFLETDCEWLLTLDSDMVFPPNVIELLLTAADPEERPIVGGLCHGRVEKDGKASYFPTIYFMDDEGRSARVTSYPVNTVMRVHATGAACLLIHRSVAEKMGGHYPEPFPWFCEEARNGLRYSEDIVFCLRAGELGFPVYVHTGVDIGHVKKEVLDRAAFAAWRDKGEP